MHEFAVDQTDVRNQIAHLSDLPPLPQALQRLMEIMHSEIASAKELESLIKYDQSLSAKILRIANSAFYGMRSQVTTLSRAIMTIGYIKARNLCLCTLLMEYFADKRSINHLQRELYWKHAFATARIAAEMANKRPWVSKEEAYILGLLHDLGRIIMAIHFQEHYRAIRNLAENRKLPMWFAEIQYGLTHTEIGRWAAVKWAFPEVFQKVMEFHHMPERSATFGPEARLICLADTLAHSRELVEFPRDEHTLSCCKALYISEDEWNDYQHGLNAVWLEVDQLWELLK
jgi:HD-like signal output (HDOD) protein